MCYTVESIDDVRNLVIATRGLSGLADLPALVSKGCTRMHRLIGSDLAAIALYDGADALVIGAAEGAVADLVGIVLPRGASLGWRSLERSMPVTTGNCAADPDSTDDLVDAIIGEEIRGLAAVPVEFGGSWLGVLYAGNRGRRVTPRVTLLMNEFAASLAPLIVTAARASRAGRLAVEEERQRIAQQLHDTAGQILFKIALSAQELRQAPGAGPDQVARSAREIEADAAEASEYLRAAMHSLMPTADALPVTIRRDAAMFAARTGTAVEVVTLGTPSPAGSAIEAVVVSAVREALHNVEKHAGANAVLVSLAYQAHEIAIAVEDDGKGLAADFELNPVPGRRAGLGIPGLLQKVQGVGGSLWLGANDDGGTSVRMLVPVGCERGERPRNEGAKLPSELEVEYACARGSAVNATVASPPRVRRVLVADDHAVVAQGIERLVAHAPDFEVVATCYSGREAIEVATRVQPDLVVLDLRLRDLDGAEVCRVLTSAVPAARVLVLTAFDDVENLRLCLEAGAWAVLLKGTLDLDLVQALRDVRDGRVVIDAGVARRLETAQSLLGVAVAPGPALRPREVDVLRLMAAGRTTKDIAADLELTVNTVRSYTQALMEKLGAHTRVQAVVFAQQHHLI